MTQSTETWSILSEDHKHVKSLKADNEILTKSNQIYVPGTWYLPFFIYYFIVAVIANHSATQSDAVPGLKGQNMPIFLEPSRGDVSNYSSYTRDRSSLPTHRFYTFFGITLTLRLLFFFPKFFLWLSLDNQTIWLGLEKANYYIEHKNTKLELHQQVPLVYYSSNSIQPFQIKSSLVRWLLLWNICSQILRVWKPPKTERVSECKNLFDFLQSVTNWLLAAKQLSTMS